MYHYSQMTIADVKVCLDAAKINLQISFLRFTLPKCLIRLGGQQESEEECFGEVPHKLGDVIQICKCNSKNTPCV